MSWRKLGLLSLILYWVQTGCDILDMWPNRRCSKSQGIHHNINQAPHTTISCVMQDSNLLYYNANRVIAIGKRQQKWQQSSQRHLCSSLYVWICCNLMKLSFLRRRYSRQGRESSGWEWLARLRARYATNQVWLRTKHLNSSVLSKFQHIFGLTIGLIEA